MTSMQRIHLHLQPSPSTSTFNLHLQPPPSPSTSTFNLHLQPPPVAHFLELPMTSMQSFLELPMTSMQSFLELPMTSMQRIHLHHLRCAQSGPGGPLGDIDGLEAKCHLQQCVCVSLHCRAVGHGTTCSTLPVAAQCHLQQSRTALIRSHFSGSGLRATAVQDECNG